MTTELGARHGYMHPPLHVRRITLRQAFCDRQAHLIRCQKKRLAPEAQTAIIFNLHWFIQV